MSTLQTNSSSPTIVISGATRGIGRAIAERFAQAGWQVAVAARSADALADMQRQWSETWPASKLLTCSVDLSTPAGAKQFARAISAAAWTVNVLVNNLGSFAPGTLLGGEEQQLANFLELNLLSAHYLSRALVPQLLSVDRAHLMTIGSVAVYDHPAPMASYMLSKHVLHAWHTALRRELAETGIHTTLLVPGATYTSSWDGIEVDPQTLLAPETVAQAVWEAWDYNQIRKTEEIILRPSLPTD